MTSLSFGERIIRWRMSKVNQFRRCSMGDLKSAQFWLDQERLYFTRLIRPTGPDRARISETQVNDDRPLGGGWIAAEVEARTDGRLTTKEEYSEIAANPALDPKLFDPQSWTTAHWKTDAAR